MASGSNATAPTCECALPAYPPPTSSDASLAPYDLGLDGGCLHPLSASLSRVTDDVLITLAKSAAQAIKCNQVSSSVIKGDCCNQA